MNSRYGERPRQVEGWRPTAGSRRRTRWTTSTSRTAPPAPPPPRLPRPQPSRPPSEAAHSVSDLVCQALSIRRNSSVDVVESTGQPYLWSRASSSTSQLVSSGVLDESNLFAVRVLICLSSFKTEFIRLPVGPLRELAALRVFLHRCHCAGDASRVKAEKLEQFLALILWIRDLQA